MVNQAKDSGQQIILEILQSINATKVTLDRLLEIALQNERQIVMMQSDGRHNDRVVEALSELHRTIPTELVTFRLQLAELRQNNPVPGDFALMRQELAQLKAGIAKKEEEQQKLDQIARADLAERSRERLEIRKLRVGLIMMAITQVVAIIGWFVKK